MRFRNGWRKYAYLCAVFILVILMLYSGIQIIEPVLFPTTSDSETEESKTIVRDGIAYFPRQDITVLMLLGIDRYGVVQPSNSYNNSGVADMVSLVIFDEASQCCNVLCLNRDTMLEMPVLGIGGNAAGEIYQQLALAHTYGSGMDDSCKNTKIAVSRFLYNLEIDYYVSMNMDAISILNDAVGGVTVVVEDDFSQIDPTISMGEVKLTGEQAVRYVQTRMGVADQTNLSRMERQTQYMRGFMRSFQQKHTADMLFAAEAYDAVSDYIVTDCSINAFSQMMDDFKDYEICDVLSPEGENVVNEKHYEFYADEQKLDELILRLFYSPKS